MPRPVRLDRSSNRLVSTVIGATVASLVVLGCGSSGSGGGTTCDVNALLLTKYNCAQSGCHDATGSGANFDMATPGIENRLVGVLPKGGGLIPSICSALNKPYLDPGSKPATGIFLRKLTPSPGCGQQMPMIGAHMTAADLACVQTWADGLTAKASPTDGGGG